MELLANSDSGRVHEDDLKETRNETDFEEKVNRLVIQIYEDIPLNTPVDISYFDVKLEREMIGMAVVDDHLFIIETGENAIKVYNSKSLYSLGRIYIPELENPRDLAGCSHDKAIYISDYNLETIFKINITTKNVKSWKLREYHKPCGLAVTSEHNVLVTILLDDSIENREQEEGKEGEKDNDSTSKGKHKNKQDIANCIIALKQNGNRKLDRTNLEREEVQDSNGDGNKQIGYEKAINEITEIRNYRDHSKIMEYTSDGQLMREIELDDMILCAHGIVELSWDKFVIYHGWFMAWNMLSVINSEGLIVKSYDRKEELGESKVGFSHSLAINKNRDRIFTSDDLKHRFGILVLNEDLILLHKIMTSKLVNSMNIYFDLNTEQLFLESASKHGDCIMMKKFLCAYILIDTCYIMSEDLVGVTVVYDMLYVAYNGEPFVRVFDSFDLAERARIIVPDMKSSADLAGCLGMKAVYITDWKLQCVHKVKLVDYTLTCWRMIENYTPDGVSITLDHNLLISLHKGNKARYSEESKVVEYTSEGQLLREIELDRSILYPSHTILLSPDYYIVSHGWGDSSHHRLCVINSDGQIIKSYGRGAGRGEGHLSAPNSLAMDISKGHLYVADRDNDRVLVFNKDLTLLGKINKSQSIGNDDLLVSSNDGLLRPSSDDYQKFSNFNFSRPTSLYFDSSTNRLFIGERNSRRIWIICSADKCVKYENNLLN